MDISRSGDESKKFTISALILIFIVSFIVYVLTTDSSPTTYNSFVRLADAFLNGRLYLLHDVPWIELAPYEGRYYMVPPPMPAVLIMPVVWVFGLSINQTLISIFFGSLNVCLAFLTARTLTNNRSVQIWSAVMFGFGTIHWWVASAGGVWTFSQTVSMTFLFLAILLTLSRFHSFLSGAALGASYWCRLPTILSMPFFLAMYSVRGHDNGPKNAATGKFPLKPIIWLCLGVGIFVILNAVYNYVRFGTPFDISYYLIPGILDEIWYREGIFDVSYIPRHLKIIFLGLPRIIDDFPYVTPSWNGMAIWITTPAFIYAFFAGIKNRLAVGCWLSIVLIAFVGFCHGTWGFMQFGYRFATDFYPFLFLLTVKGIGDHLRWHHKLLIVIGVLVNLWGMLWIYKFGWVGY